MPNVRSIPLVSLGFSCKRISDANKKVFDVLLNKLLCLVSFLLYIHKEHIAALVYNNLAYN